MIPKTNSTLPHAMIPKNFALISSPKVKYKIDKFFSLIQWIPSHSVRQISAETWMISKTNPSISQATLTLRANFQAHIILKKWNTGSISFRPRSRWIISYLSHSVWWISVEHGMISKTNPSNPMPRWSSMQIFALISYLKSEIQNQQVFALDPGEIKLGLTYFGRNQNDSQN